MKERLSSHERPDVSIMNPDTGAVLSAPFMQKAFEDLLDQHEVFTRIDQTIRRALNAARERGYSDEDIKAVLMVGGSSLIPSVQRTVQRIFGKDRVLLNRPLDAVARGAAAFVAGMDFYDHIQHDYAVRYMNPQKGHYDYHVIVKRGTPYPTKEPVARVSTNPAAKQSEPRFEVEFNIDDNKRLLISAWDLKTGRMTQRDYPMVKLT